MTQEELAKSLCDTLAGNVVRCTQSARRDAADEERGKWVAWLRLAFEAIDRHVPINRIPAELDEARRELERVEE